MRRWQADSERGQDHDGERVITPVAAGILHVSTAVRRLQHGRLQFYIFYVLVGLIALGGLVIVGGIQ